VLQQLGVAVFAGVTVLAWVFVGVVEVSAPRFRYPALSLGLDRKTASADAATLGNERHVELDERWAASFARARRDRHIFSRGHRGDISLNFRGRGEPLAY
jgi:hypothetical protein